MVIWVPCHSRRDDDLADVILSLVFVAKYDALQILLSFNSFDLCRLVQQPVLLELIFERLGQIRRYDQPDIKFRHGLLLPAMDQNAR